MAAKSEKKMSFEERLEKLEALAQKMEQGAYPLEELLKDYEEGIKLSQSLEAELEQARAHMLEVKAGKSGSPSIKPSQVAEQGSLLDSIETEE